MLTWSGGILELLEALEKLKNFIIGHDLPHTDTALFGIKCPYCGKSDRIRPLESPQELQSSFDTADLRTYTELWQSLTPSDNSLAVCKFCQNPLRLNHTQAEPLYK